MVFDQVEEDLRQLGGAAMLTEWGQGCDPNNGLVEECAAIMDLADERFMSWAVWYFLPSTSAGDLIWEVTDELITVFSRTYAQYISGTPTKMDYKEDNYDFDLCYYINPSITAPTVVYYNKNMHYPNGVEITKSGSAASYVTTAIDENDPNYALITFNQEYKDMSALDVCVSMKAK